MKPAAAGEGTVILGAGLAGLSAAYHAGAQARVFEAQARPGGECVTDQVQGFHFDRAGHLLHLQHPQTKAWLDRLLPGKLRAITREARIHLQGTECRYPFQANLFPLPTALKLEALLQYLQSAVAARRAPRNFSEWAQQTFGATISRLFMEPYNRKLWTVDPKELTLEWMKNYMPRPALERVIRGALEDVPEGGGYNQQFWYPRQGGIELLPRALAAHCPGLRLQSRVMRVDPRRRTVAIQGQGQIPWKRLVSTLPLPQLVGLLDRPPQAVRLAAKKMRANSVVVVNLGLARPKALAAHWVYFPEEKYCFYRVGIPSNYGRVSPAGTSALCAEVALAPGAPCPAPHRIVAQVRQDLAAANIVAPAEPIVVAHCQTISPAYVIFDQAYAAARKTILTFLEKQGIFCIGRWGHWEYSAMEDALLAGKAAAEQLRQA